MKYSQRVQRDDERPTVPTYCGNKGCGSVWHPPKDGHEGFYSRGFADIAVHLPDRTIYRCQKCYYDTLDGHGKTQHQVASAEYGKRHGDKEADHRGYDHH
jgi:hypothetical protein